MNYRLLFSRGTILTAFALSTACAKPREIETSDPHLQKALGLVSSDPEKALDELSKASNAKPGEVEYATGLALEKQRKWSDAAASFTKAAELVPDETRPRKALARVQILTGKIGEARKHLHFVIEKDPGDLMAIVLYALCVSGEKERTEALFALRQWPDKRPKPSGKLKQVPLRTEYFLTLAAMEKDKVRAESARLSAKRSEFGSVSAALALAQYAKGLGKMGLARSLLSHLASAEVQPEQLETIAKMSLSLGDKNTAGKALSRLPGNLRSFDILLLRGRYELAERRPQRALSPLKAARKMVKKEDVKRSDELDVLIASALAGSDGREDATSLLQEVLKRSPDHRGAHLLLSQVEMSLGKNVDAIERLKTLSQKNPKDAALLELLAQAHVKNKDLGAAEQTYRELAKLKPKDASLVVKIANLLHLQKKDDAALAELQQGVKEFPEALVILRALATQHLRSKKSEEATSAIQASVIAEKDPVGHALLLADIYDTLGRPADVRATLEALVKKVPKSDRAWSALARSQQRDKDLSGMEASLRKSLELNPRAMKDKARLATLLSKQGKSAEAAKLFAELAAVTGKDVVALNNAAMLYAVELKDPKRAVEFAEKAHKLAPKSAAVMDTLGWSLAQRGSKKDLERAVELLKKARLELTSSDSAYHYAFALIKTGKAAEGKALLRKTLKVEGEEEWREAAAALLK